jgi:hypothetical protein
MRLPSPTPLLLRSRETVVRTTFEVGGNFLQLFREYVNDTETTNGLLFKDISVSVSGARELVKHHPDVLDLIMTNDDFIKFCYMDEIVV